MSKVFISYSRKDLTFIERLAADLVEEGCDVWYDLSGLDGGMRWVDEIEKEIKDRPYMLVVLSPNAIESEYVTEEVVYAKQINKKVIPLYYHPCEVKMLYASLNRIDVQGENYKKNFDRILRAINVSKATPAPVGRVSNPTPKIEPKPRQAKSLTYKSTPDKITLSNGLEFMRVPAGKFLMGDEKSTVDIPYDYWMARYPVTNAQYNQFTKKDFDKGKENHPVVGVSWQDAMAYCERLNSLLKSELPSDLILRLPTEAEWEKAARGTDGWEYPWGNTFDKNKCNTSEGGKKDTTPVGYYSPGGDSPYDIADMSGNVWEWTHSLYKPYPYKVNDGREDEKESGARVLRGGSFFNSVRFARCAFRYFLDYLFYGRGFRVVASSLLS